MTTMIPVTMRSPSLQCAKGIMSQKSSGTSLQSEHGRDRKRRSLYGLLLDLYGSTIISMYICNYIYIYMYPYNPISNTPLHGKMPILLNYYANVPSANCYNLGFQTAANSDLGWDVSRIYHMTVTMPQPLPSQALRKASGSERVSKPKAPTCGDPKLSYNFHHISREQDNNHQISGETSNIYSGIYSSPRFVYHEISKISGDFTSTSSNIHTMNTMPLSLPKCAMYSIFTYKSG